MTVGRLARKGEKVANVITAIGTVLAMITGTWTTIAAWTPIMYAIGFALVGFALAALCKIIGVRSRGRRGRR